MVVTVVISSATFERHTNALVERFDRNGVPHVVDGRLTPVLTVGGVSER